MTDPIETLRALPPEAPPRAAVLASLRLFRYRAVATILLVAVTVLALALVARTAGSPGLDGDIRPILEHDRVEFLAVAGSAQIGPVTATVTEVAASPAGNAARVVLVDTVGTEREIDLDVLAIRQGTATLQPIVSVPSLGTDSGRRSAALWVLLDPVQDPIGAAIEWLVLPVPESILEEGGELTVDDGFTGVVTIERTTTS